MTNPISTSAARVVDPILTEVARGYKNEELVAMHLFPIVPVGQRAGKIIEFDADAFAEFDGLERAPGADVAEVEYGYGSQDYALVQHALEGKVPREIMEEAGAVPGIDMGMVAVNNTMNIVYLAIERKAAKLATTASNYTSAHVTALSSSAQWSHKDSTPTAYVEGRKELIADAIGKEPNVMVVGPDVHRTLKNNPDVLDRVKHTEGLTGAANPIVNIAKLAQYFDVERYVVGRARVGEEGKFAPVWGKNVVLAYSEVGSLASMGTPSFGYTYRLMGYPVVEETYYNRKNKSWMYPVTDEDTPVIAGKDAGVLIRTVV